MAQKRDYELLQKIRKHGLSDSCRTINLFDVTIFGNSDTGMLIGLDDACKEVLTLIGDGSLSNLDCLSDEQYEFLEALVEGGYVEDKPFYGLAKATLHVTSHCNLDCEGCYSSEEDRNSSQDLNFDQIVEIIDNISNRWLGVLSISGGEPFMRSDIIEIINIPNLIRKLRKSSAQQTVLILLKGIWKPQNTFQRFPFLLMDMMNTLL
jgi:sulfatase maturation enzyme AslB (radical SAM superfamily)